PPRVGAAGAADAKDARNRAFPDPSRGPSPGPGSAFREGRSGQGRWRDPSTPRDTSAPAIPPRPATPTDRGGVMRRAVVCALALLLAACAGVRGPESPCDVPPVPDVPASDPVGLVGLWRVSGAEGAGERTWLRLAHGSYQLWPQDECRGFAAGGWRASARVFVASAPFAANGDCSLDPWPDGDGWLTSARAYRPTGDGWELLDADGAVVAR